MLSDIISNDDLNLSQRLIMDFIFATEKLYGKQHLSMNVHLCAHLKDSVFHLGPLWSHSAFIFESCNSTLLNYVKSSNGVPLQIISRYLLQRNIPNYSGNCMNNVLPGYI